MTRDEIALLRQLIERISRIEKRLGLLDTQEGGGSGAVASVNGQTGAVVLDPDDLDDSSTLHKFVSAAEQSKLAGIEAGADVTDAGNVGSAIEGATELTSPTTITRFGVTLSGVLRWLSYANLRDAITTYYNSVVATLTNKVIDASNNTLTNINTSALANGAVSNAKLATMAQGTVKGRALGAGTGTPTDLSAAQLSVIATSVALQNHWDVGATYKIFGRAFAARDGNGLRLEDDGGNLGVLIEDGGAASIGGVWEGRPSVISTHTHVEGDMFAGNDGANVARLRMSSNASRGFIQFNRYYDGAASQQMDSTKPSWDITLEGNADYMSISRSPAGSATMAELLRLTTVGLALGSGVTSPLGSLHIHNGTGGLIFVTKTNIINSAQTIIPNATGDVTGVLIGFFVVQASGGAVANAFTMWPGDNLDITAGGYTMRLALNVNGALTTTRQSGSGSATLTIAAIWI